MEKGYIAGLVLCYLSSTSALICLSCSHVRDVRECLKVEECAPHQRCFTNLALDQHGIAMYTLGCIGQSVCDLVPDNMVGKRVSSNNSLEQVNMMKNGRGVTSTSCLQCCNNTDGCNKDLCTAKRFQSNTNTAAVTSQPCNGQTQDIPFVFPKKDTSTRQTKLRCMTCTDVMETKFCDTINECSSDQFCFAHRRMKHESGRHFYELGCMGLKQCAALRHAYLQSCFTCCNQSDFCNYAACDDHPSTHTPTGHSDITSYTTSTVPTTTTPTPQVVIQGKAKDNYMSIASLTCVTVPPAQSYSWKFNGTSRLPPHVFKMGTTQGSALAGTDTLVIANLTEATFGTYTCVVSINGHTVEDTHFIGIIAEKPTVTIEKPPVTNTFAFQCKSTGYPMPHLEWDFTPTRIGAHTIPPGVQFNDQGFISTLFVNNYHPRDHDGIWYCEAKNSQGTAIANVQIP